MKNELLVADLIAKNIHVLRNQKIMLSSDLAKLYGVPPKALIQAVKRNAERFPADFMFQLSFQEVTSLRSQTVTANWRKNRSRPYAFTEQGIAMLSSVLHSDTAIKINVEIMRVFVSLRRYVATFEELSIRIDYLEEKHDSEFKIIFDAIRELMAPLENQKRKIGIKSDWLLNFGFVDKQVRVGLVIRSKIQGHTLHIF